jgi:hypothetical protein
VAKNLLPTIVPSFTGEVSSTSRLPLRLSSATNRIVSTVPEQGEPPAPLETGSVAPPATITFGAPVVTPTRTTSFYAVQIGAGPSIDALRLSWSLLVEKHGETLGSLEPRVVSPRTEGAPYRLVAGPLTTKAEAEQVCAQMGVGRASCFSVTYVGEPL